MAKHRLFHRISNRQSAGALARTAGQLTATNLLNDPGMRCLPSCSTGVLSPSRLGA